MDNDELWLVLGLNMILGLLLMLKRTDYAVGCKRYRENGCANPALGKCSFPDCSQSRDHKSRRYFIW